MKLNLLFTIPWAFLVLIVWVLIYFYFFFNLLWGCSEEVFLTRKFPNQKEVRGVLINCGATTDFSTQFFVIKNSIKSEPLIILKGDYSEKCSIGWSDDNLDVTCKVIEQDIFSVIDLYKGIKINFYRL